MLMIELYRGRSSLKIKFEILSNMPEKTSNIRLAHQYKLENALILMIRPIFSYY